MKRDFYLLIIFLFLVIGDASVWASSVLKQIPYKKVTDLSYPKTYTLRFSLWDAETKGNKVWSEEKQIALTSSIIETLLADSGISPLDGVDFSQQLWVKVERKKVNGSYAVIGTRDRLPVAPYAIWSEGSSSGGSILQIIAGKGLTGGGISDSVALHVGAGSGINVSDDTVSIAAGGITNSMLAGNSVTSSKIADGAVTNAKITGPISASNISTTGLNADTLDGIDSMGFSSSNHNHDGIYSPVNHNHESVYLKKYAKVAIVAKSNGDYADPIAAMSDLLTWCDIPSATNPCLLKIMPGVYDIGSSSLQMQSYVDMEGSGENTTKITGNIDSVVSGIVLGASNAEIRFLMVENTGTGNYKISIFNNNNSPKITNVTVAASGSDENYGVYNYYSSPAMTNVTAAAYGSNENYGVYNYYSSPAMINMTAGASGGINNHGVLNYASSSVMTNVTATASGGIDSRGITNDASSSPVMMDVTATASSATVNYGIYNNTSSPTMTNLTATASGGITNYGVYNNTSSPTMTNVTATAASGINNYGVFSLSSGTVRIDQSVIKATTTIYNGAGVTTYVGGTRLDGGAVSNAGTLRCAGMYDETYTFSASACP